MTDFSSRVRSRRLGKRCRRNEGSLQLLVLGLLLLCVAMVHGWGSSSNSDDASKFAESYSREWLYESTALSIRVDGCVWGYVTYGGGEGGGGQDGEDTGCRENESEDGTTYWYQMANCRRAQVAYSLYSTTSGSSVSCKKNTFQESLVTKNGVAEFIYYLQTYQNDNSFKDDDGANDDAGFGSGNLPTCEYDNDAGYYLGVACGDDGSFVIRQFNDGYCSGEGEETYAYLKTLNSAMSTYTNCAGVYSASNGDDPYSSLAAMLVPYSSSCSSLESDHCMDDASMVTTRSSAGAKLWQGARKRTRPGGSSPATRLKYVGGTLLLVASFILFTGILFTNRRKRRALMQRKFRQSANKRDEARKRSGSRRRSKSRKTEDADRSKRGSSRRRSRSRVDESHGVFT